MTKPQNNISTITCRPNSIPDLHRFSHQAMAATFEIFICHKDNLYAKHAAHAAFEELDRLEADLSRFIENSDISRINTLEPHRPLPIGTPAFQCLQLCLALCEQTNGASLYANKQTVLLT